MSRRVIGIVAPRAVSGTIGGAERAWAGLAGAINEHTPDRAEVVTLPVDETSLADLIAGYRAFAEMDLGRFDLVVSSKYPAWALSHPHHVVWMFHPLRGLYDTYATFGLPTDASPATLATPEARELAHRLAQPPGRARLAGVLTGAAEACDALGADHPDVALPSPLARALVHWIDAAVLARGEVRRHSALSRTVASRAGYPPGDVRPLVAPVPPSLAIGDGGPPQRTGGRPYILCPSRLDGPKRVGLVIDAMAHIAGDVALVVTGDGPARAELGRLASADDRIELVGHVDDTELDAWYRHAAAVVFVPRDEDQGLVTLEAMTRGVPVVTAIDSGGPTEWITDDETGRVVGPDPRSVGTALAELVDDVRLRNRLGVAARSRAVAASWPATVAAVLGPPPRGPREPLPAPRPARGPRRRVVIAATFAIEPAHHGGQIRCRALARELARVAEVEVVSLVPRGTAHRMTLAPGLTNRVVPHGPDLAAADRSRAAEVDMPVTDIVIGTRITHEPAYLAALTEATATADVAIAAEPYLGPALATVAPDTPLIYDAYNIETDLKDRTLPATRAGRVLAEEAAAIEATTVDRASAVIACSAEDAGRLAARHRRPPGDVMVIPNGVDPPATITSPAQRHQRERRWLDRLAEHTGTAPRSHLAVFLGSLHLPNVAAADELVRLAPDCDQVAFICAGGHGDAFTHRRMPPNLFFTGVISDAERASLLAGAGIGLNPMTAGSGTNLKVIEYLAHGLAVLSTPFGVRGLEVTPGEHLACAEPAGFADGLTRVLGDTAGATARAAAGRDLARSHYAWARLGRRLVDLVDAVAPPG